MSRPSVRPMVWNRVPESVSSVKGLMGSVVEFRELSGNGVIGSVGKYTNHCIELRDASIAATGRHKHSYFGDYRIFDYEIKKWRLKEFRKPVINTTNHHNSNGDDQIPNDMTSKVILPSRRTNGSVDAEDDEPEINEAEDMLVVNPDLHSIDLNEDDTPIRVDCRDLTLKTSDELILVDPLADNFMTIIETIKGSHCIGLELFGQEISRLGSVVWMCLATGDGIYVFDARNKAIVSALKGPLESKELQKYLSVKVPQLYDKPDFGQFSIRVQNVIRFKTVFLRQLYALINYLMLEDLYIMTTRCVRSLRSANDLTFSILRADEIMNGMFEEPINESERTERRPIGVPGVFI
ncbi:unnamed protein product [Medioppia subpectinata]|uniref:Uncharacterized protein n=1 Tax=Medioppia subpectinata TaxID=1979941 RepID=A0A7R9KLN6_9ACAR|nr:unnamed protein product [Medioppia subpectinata]CAG2105530.1 unnamed protein product [Medioppia subpectinata]